MSKNKKQLSEGARPEEPNWLAKFLSNRILFVLHLFAYVAVSLLLLMIWAVTGLGLFWPMYEIFGWGIGIGFHAITYLMYNDKVSFLTKIRKQSAFRILFVYHAFFYSIVNILLIVINLTSFPGWLWFLWSLLIWGLGFSIHAVGFLTWDNLFQAEMKNVHEKYDLPVRLLKKKATSKLTQFWLMVIHAAYYLLITILLYSGIVIGTFTITVENQTQNSIGWGIALGLQVFSYYLFNYIEKIKPVMKGLILNIVAYAAINIWLVIYNIINMTEFSMFWATYPLILWAIVVGVHAFLTYKWDSILSGATERAKKISAEGLDDYDIRAKAVEIIFWMWSLIAHIAVYIAGVVLIAINLTAQGLDPTIVIHPIMGWMIGVAIHAAIYIVVQKGIKGFLLQVLILHAAAYIVTSVYLVILNVLFTPGFLWSVIAIGGWGIGFGFHIMIVYLTKKK